MNTGWTGGGHGSGKRISIAYTRAIITAILSGDLDKCSYQEEPIFQLLVPELVPGLPISLLTPRLAWEDHHSYDATAHDLAARFRQNFAQFGNVPPAIAQAGPLGRS